MNNLQHALGSFVYPAKTAEKMAHVLMCAVESGRISYDKAEEIAGADVDDTLLIAWQWKLLIPVRTSRCSEWDDRVLMAIPGEEYEMPSIVRVAVKNAQVTGSWDSAYAITEFFESAGEPQWRLIPVLVRRMIQGCPFSGINANQIQVACKEMEFGERTDTLIAILKGAGIISPKLSSLAQISRTQIPLYEINPCLFANEHF